MKLRGLAGPRSLAGQLALLVGVALFVAQAINFALLLGERRERRLNQVVAPAVSRLVDAAERRDPDASPPRGRRGPRRGARRVSFARESGVADAMPRRSAVEARVRVAFAEAGVPLLDARVAEVARAEGGMKDRPRRAARRPRPDRVLILSARVEPDLWLTTRAPVRGGGGAIVWRLLGQTAILYLAMLAAVLWIGRRAARPLNALTDAAAAFGRTGHSEPLPERGPADVRQLTAAFNAMRDRLGATLTEKDRMLGAIGHDLRTPLASLRLRVEGVKDPDERARMADTIAEMSQTLDDILSLAQVGRSREPASRVDLAALVDAVVEDLRDLGDDVAFEPSPRLPLTLRPVATRRALRNLLDNALKYGARATVRVRGEGVWAIVEIDDEGPGLPPDALDAVFESFARLETSRNRATGGAGLGLALARAIVRDQRGDVRLRNRTPAGLRAIVSLPLD